MLLELSVLEVRKNRVLFTVHFVTSLMVVPTSIDELERFASFECCQLLIVNCNLFTAELKGCSRSDPL